MLFLNNVFVQQSALIDDKSANKFKNQLLMPIKLTKAAEYGLIVLGAFMLICTAALFIKQKVSSKVSCDMRDLMVFFLLNLNFFLDDIQHFKCSQRHFYKYIVLTRGVSKVLYVLYGFM